MSKYLQAARNLLEGIGEDLATVFGFLKKHEAELSAAPAGLRVIGDSVDAAGKAVSIVVPPVGAGIRAAASAIDATAAVAPAVVTEGEKLIDAFGNIVDHLEGKVIAAPTSDPLTTETPPATGK